MADINTHRDEKMIHDHIKLMNDNQNRSQSNTHRLDTHEKKIDELSKVHAALSTMQTEIKHISSKMDNIAVDREVHQEQIKIQREQSQALVEAIATSNEKTIRDRIEDWVVPVLLISAMYMVFQAMQGGVI